MECPFCEREKERARLLKEGTNVFVILSNPRLVAGHTLVIPKRHIEQISELDDFEKREIFDTLIEFEKKILLFASGCDIRQNYRPFLPQSSIRVNHVHFHLIPREFEDTLYKKSHIFERDLFEPLQEEERQRILGLLR